MTDPNRKSRVGADAPWPKGVPRNPPSKAWLALKAQLVELIGAHWRYGVITQRALAEHVGVNDRTVGRWLADPDHPRAINPSPQHVRRMRSWYERMAARATG